MIFKEKIISIPDNRIVILEGMVSTLELSTYKVRIVIAEQDSQNWLYSETIQFETKLLCDYFIAEFDGIQLQQLQARFYFSKLNIKK